MGLFRALKHYRKKLEKRFTRQITRKQLNFVCDERIILGLKIMAGSLEVPIYPIAEHLLQLGAAEVLISMKDEALRERLCRHLVEDHLLTPVTRPESEPVSRRALRIDNALKLLELLETRSSPEAQRDVILRLMEETGARDGA